LHIPQRTFIGRAGRAGGAEAQSHRRIALTEAFTAVGGAAAWRSPRPSFCTSRYRRTFGFWRGLARRYFTALCKSDLDNAADLMLPRPAENDWIALAETAPPMKGLDVLERRSIGPAMG